jgi:hypothetical protein
MIGLFDGSGQFLVVGIDDEHRVQLCGVGVARIAADGMERSRSFVKTFPAAKDLPGSVNIRATLEDEAAGRSMTTDGFATLGSGRGAIVR